MIIAAVVLMTLPHERQLALSTSVRSTVLAPVLQLRATLSEMRTSRARIQELRAERDALAARLMALQDVEEANAGLRGLLGLSQRAKSRFVPANLYPVGRTGERVRRSFVIDVGASAGIGSDAAVVSPAGLVGVVRAAGPAGATGDFWTHPEFRVSAVTVDGEVFGIIRPVESTPPLMQLEGAPYQTELAAGTELVTSGLGGVFPRGIPIGRVEELIGTEIGWAKSYLVRPFVYPDAAREVMVLVSNGETAVGVADVWNRAVIEAPN